MLLGAISDFMGNYWQQFKLGFKKTVLAEALGWAGLIFAVYAFNYLWAPLIDRIQIPWLTKRIGHRRGWIVLMQFIILLCLVSGV